MYNQLLSNWLDRWVFEFGSDMTATYLLGPAFGWQHVRLCAGQGPEVFYPTLGEAAEHPADEARLRGITAVLERMGAHDPAASLQSLWHGYVSPSGSSPSTDYGLAYPQSLLDVLAGCMVDGCRQLGIRGFDELAHDPNDIAVLIAEAWDRFLADPDAFGAWEQARLAALWNHLGC